MPCTRSQASVAVARVTCSTRDLKIRKLPNPKPGSKQPTKKTSNLAVVGKVSLTISDDSVSPYPVSAAEVPTVEIPAVEVPAVELSDVAGSEERCK